MSRCRTAILPENRGILFIMTKKERNKSLYKRLYKEYYGINFDGNFDIHHINGDCEDNNIANLVLLPKELHRIYHKVEYECFSNTPTTWGLFTSLRTCDENAENLAKLNQLFYWYDLKLQADEEIMSSKREGRCVVNFYQKEVDKYGNNI